MKKVIRLNESDLMKLVKKVIKEAPEMQGSSMAATTGPGTNIPDCNTLAKKDNRPGGGQTLIGPFDKYVANFTVPPQYQGYTLYKQGKPYCLIPKR